MSATDMNHTLDILRSLYLHIRTLEEFAGSIVFREGQRAVLIEESDTNRFKSFVRGVFVCFDKELQQVPSCNQICTLPELLAFILNTLKRKRKKNILAHGYNFLSLAQEERDADHFKFQGDVTQSAAYIHGSDLWKKVTMRLGTDLTRYLLESCSVFVAVPPSCAFQVCGAPVYDRISMTTSSTGLYVQPRSKTHHGAHFRRNRGAVTLKRRQKVENPTITKTRNRRDVRVKEGKRKRETVLKDEEEIMTRLGKRRRVGQQEPTHEMQHVCYETVEEGQPMSVDQTLSKKSLENGTTGSKQPVEIQTSIIPLEGGPSWRSGIFPPLPPSQCFIRTLGFLYGGKGMRGFLLNRKKKSADGCRRLQGQDLVRTVFFEGLGYLNGLERKPKKLPRRFFKMVPLFSHLLRQHRRCPYSKILQRMCPVGQERGADQGELSSLLPQHCAPHRVYLFVRECLSTVIPQELWGSDRNRLLFFYRVKGFLRSGKFERLSLAELMWKMNVNDCDWLKISKTGRYPPSELSHRTRILGQFLAWLLDGYVVGLVRACFYVTESVGQKNVVRFYRQEVWAKLQEIAFRGHLSKGQMEELTPAQVASLPKDTVISRLRFIPKTDSMRPITRIVGADAKTRLYQGHVRDLLDTLRACVRSTPSLLGSTVWGMTDIHKVLRSQAPAQKDKLQPLYFVKVDVSGAYESLPHDRLIEVIGQALSPVQEELFTIRRYAKVWADSHEGLKKSFLRQADLLEDNMGSTNMKGFVTSLQKRGKVHHAILVEQHFCSDLYGREALQFFTQMLTGSVVQFGKKTYRQCRGIPQGSVVSSLLCCLCYGHMENVLFKDITAKKGCMMRLVDDFLLITPDLQEAQHFLKTLLAGVPQYGLVVNPHKVAVNFQVSGNMGSCPGIRVLSPHCLFPWCGLLLDTHSLDVYKDYSSYAGLSLRYSLTLGSIHSAGWQMRRKLMAILRLKCHPLFLDLKTNSLEAVYKNIYKLVLLHACRFHVCAQSLPFGQTVAKNPLYFLQMILNMAEYANQLIRHSNKGMILGSKAMTGIMQYEAVELLFCLSFLLVLSQHRPLYKDLLPYLHKRKRSLERCLGDLRLARVRQATNPRTPVDFLAILM
ncbi:telomerase reverse transcriptase isoform X2 [Etheostoma cragini]|uniref:telomerase reverse transcriptase isoform X1 n=1 Tax=Etheostoma cragini TaxID=417921 RepID=UPI00155E362C|nr:telomerase reverse transcriptase isoform X1 [Etheostoma cragini]XP_034747662.1 telomerase reverse transcriptase isoform X1 [Etheostoma cragini]XP_034747663.1 telomerase reverse transcriptase isoform X2 [Etheostoma cragini]